MALTPKAGRIQHPPGTLAKAELRSFQNVPRACAALGQFETGRQNRADAKRLLQGKFLLHFHGHGHTAAGIFLLALGVEVAKKDHHRVANVFVDRRTVLEHHTGQQGEILVQVGRQRLWLQASEVDVKMRMSLKKPSFF